MKVLSIVLVGLSSGVLIAPFVNAKTCATFYVDPNYGGSSWAIEAETQSDDVSGAMYERRHWCGTLRGYCRGHDRSWNDSISSITVGAGCTLFTWQDGQFSGNQSSYPAGGVAGIGYSNLSDDDQITSFKCSCEQVVISTVGDDPVSYILDEAKLP